MIPLDRQDHGAQHNAAAEQALIGAALLDPQVPDLTGITAGDFWQTRAETTWQTITTINGAPDRPAAVLQHWRTTGQLRDGHLDGPWLHDCIQACATPHAAQQYADIVRRDAAARRATTTLQRALQQLGRADHDDTTGQALLDAMDALEDGYRTLTSHSGEKNKRTTWTHVDVAAVIDGHDIDPPPTLMPRTDGQCLVYPGAVHTISGEPGTGKTWAALYAATAELERGQPITFIDYEDRASRVISRLLALGSTIDQLTSGLRYLRPTDPLATRDRDGTWQHHQDHTKALRDATHGAALVIIDGVTEAMTVHGLDLNSNPDVAAFYELLPRRIARDGPAVILIDHVVKDSERQGRWGIGGQHKLAGIDGVAYLAKTVEPFGRGHRGRARLIISKDRAGLVQEHATGQVAAEFVLDATDPHCLRCRLDPAEPMPTDKNGAILPTVLMERVSRWVETHPRCTRREISAAVKGKQEYVMRAIDALTSEGYVEVQQGERRAQHHHSLTPYRVDDEEPE